MIPFPAKKYEIIYADPPWAYNDKLGGLPKYGAMTYNTMTQDELAGLPIREITAKNCILFMWATMPKLQEALDTIKAWGFKYKTCAFCWVKQNPNGGGSMQGSVTGYRETRNSAFWRRRDRPTASADASSRSSTRRGGGTARSRTRCATGSSS